MTKDEIDELREKHKARTRRAMSELIAAHKAGRLKQYLVARRCDGCGGQMPRTPAEAEQILRNE